MPRWKVVGGADKGGILVREGFALKSPQVAARLATQSLVAELEVRGERLKYQLLSGSGPAEGWVSFKMSGKDLLVPIEDKLADPGISFGIDMEELRAKAESDNSMYVQHAGVYPAEWDGLLPPPPRGQAVPVSTGRAQAGLFWTPRVPTVPKELRKITPFDEFLKAKPRKEFEANMDALGDEGPIGYFYGLRFPYTLEQIKRYGAEFLTDALHMAGTLPQDNSVVAMEVEQFVAGSMSQKCFLKLEYAKADDSLHTDLFVKYPFAAASMHDRKSVYISRFFLNNDGPEMDFGRILSAGAPMKCPKYYFGDICLKTGTALYITEKLPLPGASDDFGPYELEAIPYKSVDYLLDKPFDYYDAMTRNVARLAAWGKCGKLGADIEEVFPPAAHPAAYFMNTEKRLENYLHFVLVSADCLLPDEISGPKGAVREEEWFVKTMRYVMPEVEKKQHLILDFLFQEPDYQGFTHQNMNTDNAMFWRDEHGKVCSGFIDWGRFKRDNHARGLNNGYMCCDLCELVQLSDEKWIRNFIETFEEAGGPHLDFDLFWEHYMLSWLLQGLSVVDMPRQLDLTGWKYLAPESWKSITSYKDPRIFRTPNYSSGYVAILRNFAFYWRCRDLPAFWELWKKKRLDQSGAKLRT